MSEKPAKISCIVFKFFLITFVCVFINLNQKLTPACVIHGWTQGGVGSVLLVSNSDILQMTFLLTKHIAPKPIFLNLNLTVYFCSSRRAAVQCELAVSAAGQPGPWAIKIIES